MRPEYTLLCSSYHQRKLIQACWGMSVSQTQSARLMIKPTAVLVGVICRCDVKEKRTGLQGWRGTRRAPRPGPSE